MHRASLNEAAAAGVLWLAGWPEAALGGVGGGGGSSSSYPPLLLDPMCGSGTLLIEAGLIARGVPGGANRDWWPFMTWPDANREAWTFAAEEAADIGADCRRRCVASGLRLLGNDVHPGALSLARRDADAAGVGDLVELRHGPCGDLPAPPTPPSLVVVNPPWGRRIGGSGAGAGGAGGKGSRNRVPRMGEGGGADEGDAGEAWTQLGQCLRRCCADRDAFVLSGSKDLTSRLRLRASGRHPITIGDVSTRLLRYEVGAWRGEGDLRGGGHRWGDTKGG